MMYFYDKVVDQLKLIKSKTDNDDDAFVEFMEFFGREYDKLSKKEQQLFILMMDRDKKLNELINEIR